MSKEDRKDGQQSMFDFSTKEPPPPPAPATSHPSGDIGKPTPFDKKVAAANFRDTSRSAGRSVDSERMRGKVFACICERGNATCDEVEVALGRHQTISARVFELHSTGKIVDSGERRPTRSGRKAIVWRPA